MEVYFDRNISKNVISRKCQHNREEPYDPREAVSPTCFSVEIKLSLDTDLSPSLSNDFCPTAKL